jgi:hypothetical protein
MKSLAPVMQTKPGHHAFQIIGALQRGKFSAPKSLGAKGIGDCGRLAIVSARISRIKARAIISAQN